MSHQGTGPADRYRSLQARLAAAPAERDAAIAGRDAALSQDDRLRRLLHQLQRMRFGRHSARSSISAKCVPKIAAICRRRAATGRVRSRAQGCHVRPDPHREDPRNAAAAVERPRNDRSAHPGGADRPSFAASVSAPWPALVSCVRPQLALKAGSAKNSAASSCRLCLKRHNKPSKSHAGRDAA